MRVVQLANFEIPKNRFFVPILGVKSGLKKMCTDFSIRLMLDNDQGMECRIAYLLVNTIHALIDTPPERANVDFFTVHVLNGLSDIEMIGKGLCEELNIAESIWMGQGYS
jgi:hypothetical protein